MFDVYSTYMLPRRLRLLDVLMVLYLTLRGPDVTCTKTSIIIYMGAFILGLYDFL